VSRSRCARRYAVESLDTGLQASAYHSSYSEEFHLNKHLPEKFVATEVNN